MKLVVGLGNPGRRYDGTRHNVGFEVVYELARRHAGGNKPKIAFQSETIEATYGQEKLLLVCPQTFMNRSGQAVGAACGFYQIPAQQVLVICDDFHLPLGKLRVRTKGSAGGQKGLQDIIQRLATDEVPRLRIGVGEVPPNWNAADYVLSRFDAQEKEEIKLAIVRGADAAECWAAEGIEKAMSRFN